MEDPWNLAQSGWMALDLTQLIDNFSQVERYWGSTSNDNVAGAQGEWIDYNDLYPAAPVMRCYGVSVHGLQE